MSQYIAVQARDEAFWQSVGVSIRKFHEAGVYHADMNAYNIQIDKDGDVWMLDFDKGALRAPGTWQQETLSRLHRSLQKIRASIRNCTTASSNGSMLLRGYFRAAKSE